MHKVPKAVRPPRGLWRSAVVIAPVVLLLILVATLAAPPFTVAQDGPPSPANIMVVNGPNGGEAIVTWDAVDGANFYRIGWLSRTDYQDAGDDWLERFAFSEVADKTSYTVTRLTPGKYYWFIVASNATRYGAPTWPATWAPLTLNEDDAACPIAETTPTAMPPTGDGTTRSSPIPYGQKFQAGNFDIQITAFDEDAWPEIMELPRAYNPPPASGYRYVMWTIKVENKRGSFDRSEPITNSSFRLVGSRGVQYSYSRQQNRCTVIPNNLSALLFLDGSTEGNVCLSVPTDETGFVLRYDGAQRNANGELFGVEIWFAALPPAEVSETSSDTASSTVTVANVCTGDDYDRDEWGDYPGADSSATPTWTASSDVVASRDITMDHHVALKDAHTSGGCAWSATKKNEFAMDSTNLNPTTLSFNSSKSSRTPDQLTGIALSIIDTDSEKCDYATQHDEVKDAYDLTMTASEQVTVNQWLVLCP